MTQNNARMEPWDQRLARVFVRLLERTPVTPNQLTAVTLALALAGAGLLASGRPDWADWGAGLFVLARFMDHFDGELARRKGLSSRFGYYFDYVAGGTSYAALFLGIGIGLAQGPLGGWSLVLGIGGMSSALISMGLNLGIDKALEHGADDGVACGYPSFAGFELEDGIYLIAPITWAGFLTPFFVLAGTGATIYCLWTLATLLRLRRGRPTRETP